MGDIVELTFENVRIEAVPNIIILLTSSGKNVVSYNVQCENEPCKPIDWNSHGSIRDALRDLGDGSIYLNINNLNSKILKIEAKGIQIFKYGDAVDINISFALTSINTKNVSCMLEFSRSLACKYKASSFYAGLEPANDEETRIFTNNNMGPIIIRDEGNFTI